LRKEDGTFLQEMEEKQICLSDCLPKIVFQTKLFPRIVLFSFWHCPKKKQKGLALDIFYSIP